MVVGIKDNGDYRVKLHFMEPRDFGSGKRVFDVSLQGETVLSELDVARAAGGCVANFGFFVGASKENLKGGFCNTKPFVLAKGHRSTFK